MQTYKTFLKIVVKMLPIIAVYMLIFCLLTIFRSFEKSQTDFSDIRLVISIVNKDNSPSSKILEEHLRSANDVVELKSYDDEFVQDSLYYFSTQAVITINEDFEQKLADGDIDGLVESRRLPSTYVAQFSDAQISRFLKTAALYTASGVTPEEACRKAAESDNERTEVTVLGSTSESVDSGLANFFGYYGFGAIYIIFSALIPVMTKFFDSDIRRRIDSSPISVFKKTLSLSVGGLTVISVIWLTFILLAQLRYGDVFSPEGLKCLANSLIYSLVAASLALFFSALFKSRDTDKNALSGITNVVGLGLSFICGVFVPQDLLGSGVLSAARFLPTYWYVKANNNIFGICGEVSDQNKLFGCFGIQLLFAAAFFALYLAFTKQNVRSAD
ncbi:MAG: ABC transporter permease [Ruminococcus sp.]|nr:ABC transporter permease [Ruminococcus sp.]